MAWYREGAVAVTNGSTTVTGTNTDFAANSRVGDAFIGPDGVLREVTNVTSATVLSIFPAYSGATAAGAAYTLAPIQGYVKHLADQARQIISQWGATLAGLGAVATENVLPVAKGGTGATTQALARVGLGLKTAAVADIVGTVTQSGGVPAGAVLERGNNSNGEYTKYADGTLECWAVRQCTYNVGTLLLNTWSFPAVFVATPVVSVTLVQGSASEIAPVSFTDVSPMVGSVSATSCTPRAWRGSGTTSVFPTSAFMAAHCRAIGRWYQ